MEKAGERKKGKLIEERTRQEMINKTKARTITDDKDKWESKKYLHACDSDTMKDVIKIGLQIWQVNCNYKKDNTDTKCPLCKISEDTIEHVLECEKTNKFKLNKKKQQGKMGTDNRDLKKE